MEKELIILLGNEREKMYLDLNTHSHMVVVADRGFGKTTFLENIAEQVLKSDEDIEMYVLSEAEAFIFDNKYKNINYITLNDLEDTLNNLSKREGICKNEKRVVLVIDTLSGIFDSLTEECKYKLDYILRLGRGLKVNLLMSSVDENLIKMANVPVRVYGRNGQNNRELCVGEFLIKLDICHRNRK